MVEKRSKARLTVRRLSALDAAAYRDLRLAGLLAHPGAFGASWEEEADHPLAWFEDRLNQNVIFGGEHLGTATIDGVAGFYISDGAKQSHKGVLWGMFIRPEARGTGLGASLIIQVLEHARHVVEEVRLTVVASNTNAIRLYERAGFERYGLEQRALKIGADYYDQVLMALTLR